jgi:hypothetical protein
MFWVCELAQGQPISENRAISSRIGQAKPNSGRRKSARPRPLENQITISLSRYMRDSVPTIETNRQRLRMVGM